MITLAAANFSLSHLLTFSPSNRLSFNDVAEQSSLCHQFVKTAILHDTSFVDYNDTVALSDGAQTVGNGNSGTLHIGQILGYDVLTDVIECPQTVRYQLLY
jgi:hypothetical protein